MRQTTFYLLGLLVTISVCSPITKRQTLDLDDHPSLDPAAQDLSDLDEENRDKRKIESAVELKYGAKNAILGLIFNKINSFIDQKTRWVDQLDRSNIAKNRAYGIEAPKDPVHNFGTVFSSVLTNKLQAAGPIISLVTSKIGGLSAGGSGGSSNGDGHNGGGGGSGSFLTGITSLLGGASGSSNGGGHGASVGISFGPES